MAEGKYYAGGVQRFFKEGSSPQEKSVEFSKKPFQLKLEQLRDGDAKEIAEKYEIGRLVDDLLSRYNRNPEALTEEVCTDFLKNTPGYEGYDPALVRAVAEEIEIKRRAEEELRRKSTH